MDYETCVKRETRKLRWHGIKMWLYLFGAIAASFVLPAAAYFILGGTHNHKDGLGESMIWYWSAQLFICVLLAFPAAGVLRWLENTKDEAERICRQRAEDLKNANAKKE